MQLTDTNGKPAVFDPSMSLTPRGPRAVSSPRIGANGQGFRPTPAAELVRLQLEKTTSSFATAGTDAVELMRLVLAHAPNAPSMFYALDKSCEAVTAAGNAFLAMVSMLVLTIPVPQEPEV